MRRTVKTIVDLGVLGFSTAKVLQVLTKMKRYVKILSTVKEKEILGDFFSAYRWGDEYTRNMDQSKLEFTIPCAPDFPEANPEADDSLRFYFNEAFPELNKLKIIFNFIPTEALAKPTRKKDIGFPDLINN